MKTNVAIQSRLGAVHEDLRRVCQYGRVAIGGGGGRQGKGATKLGFWGERTDSKKKNRGLQRCATLKSREVALAWDGGGMGASGSHGKREPGRGKRRPPDDVADRIAQTSREDSQSRSSCDGGRDQSWERRDVCRSWRLISVGGCVRENGLINPRATHQTLGGALPRLQATSI